MHAGGSKSAAFGDSVSRLRARMQKAEGGRQKEEHFPFVICHLSFFILLCSQTRLSSVRK